jgi:hypothetical protein
MIFKRLFFVHVFIGLLISGNFSACQEKILTKPFPARNEVLAAPFGAYDNFMPLALIETNSDQPPHNIPLLYVAMQYDTSLSKYFTGTDNADHLTFSVSTEGRLIPLFEEGALHIDSSYQRFYKEQLQAYREAKKKVKAFYPDVLFGGKPDWWQQDETPAPENGQPYRFICQAEMMRFIKDDCKVFVFYNEAAHKVKYIYQRT